MACAYAQRPGFLGRSTNSRCRQRTRRARHEAIVFENRAANIKVRGAFDYVTVSGRKLINAYRREDADRANGETAVEIIPQGDRLVVRTIRSRDEQSACRDDLEVTVPRGLAWNRAAARGDTK